MYGMSGQDSETAPAFTPPKWRKPAPLSYGHAIDSVGTVGSSLLAGFSLASVIVVTGEAHAFRWPGATVLALAAAAVVLIASVQFTYNTRQFLWSPGREHLPGLPPDPPPPPRLSLRRARDAAGLDPVPAGPIPAGPGRLRRVL